ncbi:MAG: HAD family phosphatase [Anaerolineales bacterium]|nr:HAD family phosphatase [Anaerolineales bacterium]
MKTIIWDMGGVLLRTEDQSLRRTWEEKLGLQQGQLHDLIFGNDLSRQASIGKASQEDIWFWVQQKLSLTDQEMKDLRSDFFKYDLIDQDLMVYIRSLKQDYTVGMITNAWPDIRFMLTSVWHVADAFESIIVSAEVGIVKPDAAIYHMALEALDTAPGEAVFIDDYIENIRGAEAVGMKGIHFTDREKTIQQLNALLLST